jgi:hypothetical protein
MFRLIPGRWQDDHTASTDEVILVDSSVMAVPRGNLAAAKELLAAQKAAQRRVAARWVAFGQTTGDMRNTG